MRPALLLAGALTLGACARRELPQEPLSELPDFSMSAVGPAAETPFGRKEMLGRVWVADFIFTRCGSTCPMLTASLARLAKETPPELGLLSVSVDPDGDTPERLRAYARTFGADSSRWVFLRGGTRETYRLLYAGFRLPLSTDPKAEPEARVQHSTRFVLVDRRGAVRGYYDGLNDEERAALARDARKLLEAGS